MDDTPKVSEKPLAWDIPDTDPNAGFEAPDDGLAVSEKVYWETYYEHPDFSYEWNDGYLEAKPMADFKGSKIYQWFYKILSCYLSTHKSGEIINLEIGFRLALPHKTSIRIPDMAVFLNTNRVNMEDDDNAYAGIFDLCVESLSYSSIKEIRRDTVFKKEEYEGIGVKEYYILDARGLETAFYARNNAGTYDPIRPDSTGIIRSGVLPGFQFRISDLYSQPMLETLAEDEVYYQYVFPAVKFLKQRAEAEKLRADNEKQRADEEKQRADEEKQRADEEKQRADRLAAKLAALGIDPD